MKSKQIPQPKRWLNLIWINVYYLGLTTLSQTLTPLLVPLLVQQFVGITQQGTAYGNLRLWTLMVAVLVQSLMGLVSDRSTFRWGKRRPFIAAGTLIDLVLIILIGLSANLTGDQGYWILFSLIILVMIATNTAHGALQGFIPDLVPIEQRGIASGIKAIFEIPLPLILVAFTIGPLIANNQLWAALFVLMTVLILVTLLAMQVKEPHPDRQPAPINWQPFTRLVVMTAVFTLIILILGWLAGLLRRFISSDLPLSTAMLVVGAVGLLAMSLAIGVGVLVSVRIGLGKEESQANPDFSWWVVNRLAFLTGSTNLAGFAVFFLQGRLGFPQQQAAGPASVILLIVGVFILITAIPSGWVADRVGQKTILTVSGLTAAGGVVLITISGNLLTVYLGAVLVGFATGTFYTANWALGTRLVPKDQAGRYLGISNLAGAGAGAVGAFIGGPVADYFTLVYPEIPGIGYVVLFGIFGILFLLSTFVLKFVKVR